MKTVAILLTIFAAASALKLQDLIKEEWAAFKLQHKKDFTDTTEEDFRMKIFLENRNRIAKHNQKYEQGVHSFKLGLNKYSDLLPYEFVSIMNGFNKSNSIVGSVGNEESGPTFISPANVKLPNSVDWTTKGAVSPVKDQGHCGSCWSFSATGALEGQHFRKTGVLVSLSEQNLVDCSTSYGNNGCNGGLMDNAFKYIKQNGGIDTEKSYPYEGVDDTCRFETDDIGATDKGAMDIPEGDEKKLMEAVAIHGPVSVAIDASQQSFQFYSEGVYYDEHCSNITLDHGVLVVGYGTAESGDDYWLVKNSWGTTWGDQGFIKMARNKDNHCGIASSASFPLV